MTRNGEYADPCRSSYKGIGTSNLIAVNHRPCAGVEASTPGASATRVRRRHVCLAPPAVPGYDILEGGAARGGYRALHHGLKRQVALKFTLEKLQDRPETLRRFRSDGEGLPRLRAEESETKTCRKKEMAESGTRACCLHAGTHSLTLNSARPPPPSRADQAARQSMSGRNRRANPAAAE